MSAPIVADYDIKSDQVRKLKKSRRQRLPRQREPSGGRITTAHPSNEKALLL